MLFAYALAYPPVACNLLNVFDCQTLGAVLPNNTRPESRLTNLSQSILNILNHIFNILKPYRIPQQTACDAPSVSLLAVFIESKDRMLFYKALGTAEIGGNVWEL